MRIAYILNAYPQPSHSFIRREMQAMERRGHEVVRLAMRRPDAPPVDIRNTREMERTRYVLSEGGAALLAAATRQALAGPARFLGALRAALAMGRRSEAGRLRHLIYLIEAARVVELCREAGAIHAHAHFGTNSAAIARLARLLGGPRYSVTVHGPEEFDAPRALSLDDKIRDSAFTVGVSQFGRSQLCRWADLGDWPRLAVIHCGIEPDPDAAPAPSPDGPLRLVSIGRFVEQKGQMVLIQALARIRDQHPDAHLVLLGDGPLRPDLERAIAEAGLGSMVTLTGWVDEMRVNAELCAAHALVMPSFAEGLPMVVMEAMAAARPVVTTAIAGIPELVDHGRTGWLVPAGDAAALAAALCELAEMPAAARVRMGEAGRTRVLARHDIDASAERLEALVEAAARS
ncbi:glycosyltransferase [uncultured Jannaschia sp.]|uniref:glycosyltransferase n=1 Tax=uncultured Jannaschia sp. TaxID=293347 RepID=UPI002635597D|nr:glycosyltransferase [uncultured Jannaschia sp.]